MPKDTASESVDIIESVEPTEPAISLDQFIITNRTLAGMETMGAFRMREWQQGNIVDTASNYVARLTAFMHEVH